MLVDHYEQNYIVLQIAMKNMMQNNQSGAKNSFVGHLPHYAGLEWRLDATVGSRALPSNKTSQAFPLITMNLKLRQSSTKPSYSVNSESLQEHERDHNILLQTDPVNLCHITDVLENALKEARSQKVRKLQRQF